jgi:4-alpha-glucanotransferase
LAGVAAHAGARGLALGVYGDLAVGAAPSGADVWAWPELFARGAELGAPPDPFAWEGQNWGLAPIVPWRSVRDGHGFFRRLCAHNMAHAGALRIDHAMGLRRQFWVPEGLRATEGAYVRCPEAAWFDIVAEESIRHACVVIGEDLGTVPDGFREQLASRGILRSQVLYFERDERGEFRGPEHYAPLALATANSHDLPTLRGLWEAHDLALRRERGALPDEKIAHAEAERQGTREALVRHLRARGLVAPDAWPDYPVLRRAVYLALAGTPCALLGVALDDLAGETEAVNMPGAADPRGHNWTRRMARDLTALTGDATLDPLLRELAEHRGAHT